MLKKHEVVFDGSLRCMKGAKVTLQVDEKKPRSVPFLLKEKVGKELDRLEQLGIISPAQHSQWAAPIAKKDGGTPDRFCLATL